MSLRTLGKQNTPTPGKELSEEDARKRFQPVGGGQRSGTQTRQGGDPSLARDIPAIAFSYLNGILGGAPRAALQNPTVFSPPREGASVAGPVSQGIVDAQAPAPMRNLGPLDAKTLPGKAIGVGAELYGGFTGLPGKGLAEVGKQSTRLINPNIARITIDDMNFARKVQGDFFQSLKGLPEKFGKQMDTLEKAHPEKFVSSQESLFNLVKAMKENSAVKARVLAGVKASGQKWIKEGFENLLESDLDSAASIGAKAASNMSVRRFIDMTLKDSQEVYRAVKQAPGFITELGKKSVGKVSNFDVTELPLADFITDLREAQLRSFPQFEEVVKNYAKVKGATREVGRFFDNLHVMDSVRGQFGSKLTDETAMKLLSPEVVKQIGGARKAVKFVQGAQALGRQVRGAAVGAPLTAGAYYLLNKLFGER